MYVDVSHSYGQFLLHVAFRSAKNGITALFGHSGAGKTSLINMIAGLVKPQAGFICVNGRCLFDSSKAVNLRPEQRRIGYVFQEGRLFPHLSVKNNLIYGMKLLPPKERKIALGEVVELLGIEKLLSRRPKTLSGGEKQRVAIGRALLMNPLLLLMDEPLASLDMDRKLELLPFIKKLNESYALPVLYVSHAAEEIRLLASEVIVLEAGRVKVHGSLEEALGPQEEASCGDSFFNRHARAS